MFYTEYTSTQYTIYLFYLMRTLVDFAHDTNVYFNLKLYKDNAREGLLLLRTSKCWDIARGGQR